METTIRGILEKEIESMTHPDILGELVQKLPETFPTKSLEDCLFGFIVGVIFGRFVSLTKAKATAGGAEEFWDLLERRAMEIRGKIIVSTATKGKKRIELVENKR